MPGRSPRSRSALSCYVRVSTSAQADSGIGLAAQRETIRRACDLHGFAIGGWFEDAGLSGARMSNRPALQQALSEIRAGRSAGLVCAKLDRLGRSAAEVLTLAEQSKREGWRLLILDVGADTLSLSGEAVLMALAMAARIEHVRIAERQRDKHEALRRAGRARGRKAVDRDIADRIIGLRESGSTWQAVADTLNEEKIPTARSGAIWRPSSVQSAYRTRQRELLAQIS
jgi:DNA invertase Pin-like site-specific DNA recombinase